MTHLEGIAIKRSCLLVFTLIWTLIGATAATAAASATAATAAGSQAPIAIGLLTPLTGAWETDGQSAVRAVLLAADEINTAGGVLGRPLALLVEDSESDVAAGAAAARKIADAGVVAALATYGTAVADPAARILDSAGILNISWGASAVYLTEDLGLRRFFRINVRDDVHSAFFVRFVTETLGATRIALIHDGTAYAHGLADAISLAAEQTPNAQIVHVEQIAPGPAKTEAWDEAHLAPLREALVRVKAADPEVLFYTGYAPEAAQLARLAREIELEAQFILGNAAVNDAFLDQVPQELSEGLIISQQVLPSDLDYPESEPFVQAYLHRYGSLPRTPYAFYAADALRVIAAAIAATGSTDSSVLAEYLRSMEPFPGVTGPVSFDEVGDRVNGIDLYRAYVVRGGELVLYLGDSVSPQGKLGQAANE